MFNKNEKLNIRKASKKDLKLMVNFGEKLFELEKKYEPLLFFNRSESFNRYQKELNNKDALFLIAELNNKPVGYLYAHLTSNLASLEAFKRLGFKDYHLTLHKDIY